MCIIISCSDKPPTLCLEFQLMLSCLIFLEILEASKTNDLLDFVSPFLWLYHVKTSFNSVTLFAYSQRRAFNKCSARCHTCARRFRCQTSCLWLQWMRWRRLHFCPPSLLPQARSGRAQRTPTSRQTWCGIGAAARKRWLRNSTSRIPSCPSRLIYRRVVARELDQGIPYLLLNYEDWVSPSLE